MSAPDPIDHEDETTDENLGLYRRATQAGAEWWRVSVGDRPETYRLEHGADDDENGAGAVDIDLGVDAEKLRAKLKKWRREGFALERDVADATDAPTRIAFMPELQR